MIVSNVTQEVTLTLARGRGSTARGGRGGPARREGEGGRGEGRRPRPLSAPPGPRQRRGREGRLSPQPRRARPPARPVNTGPRERINRQGGPRGALPDGREREGGGKAGGRGPAAPRPAPDSAGAARAG